MKRFKFAGKPQAEQEREDAAKVARVAKLTYDAALEEGFTEPQALAVAASAARQECTEQ